MFLNGFFFFSRFGCGIVIYWKGYVDKVGDCKENGTTIFVKECFPAPHEIQLLNFKEIDL